MASFIIEGGRRLTGEIVPQGAKNEALQVICATLLTSEPVRIKNIPDISDVNNQIRLLEDVGVKVTRNAPGDFTFQADEVNMEYVQSDEFLARCTKLRGSVMLIGPMIARFGRAMVAKPGGDKIGRRRLDTHFLGIQKLGAKFDYDIRRGIRHSCRAVVWYVYVARRSLGHRYGQYHYGFSVGYGYDNDI